jgi:DNA-directed RNA polymerase specialized sigma24 family protein
MFARVSSIATVSIDLEEIRLIAAAKRGDKVSYRQLLAGNQAAAFRAAYLLAGSSDRARDATIQAGIEAWASLPGRPSTRPFGPWLTSIAVDRVRAASEAGAEAVQLPPVPDVTAVVLARLAPRPRHRAWPVRQTVVCSLAAAALAIAASLVLLGSRHDVAGTAASRPALGERIPLTQARHAAGFTALLPPQPSAAYIGRHAPGGRLSLLDGPALITEFRGTTIPYILTLIGPGAHAELTWVNGRIGVYGDGTRTSAEADVLTWLQGPLTVRIAGAHTLENALALARSLS